MDLYVIRSDLIAFLDVSREQVVSLRALPFPSPQPLPIEWGEGRGAAGLA
jgi:hypothetical protein